MRYRIDEKDIITKLEYQLVVNWGDGFLKEKVRTTRELKGYLARFNARVRCHEE